MNIDKQHILRTNFPLARVSAYVVEYFYIDEGKTSQVMYEFKVKEWKERLRPVIDERYTSLEEAVSAYTTWLAEITPLSDSKLEFDEMTGKFYHADVGVIFD